jgi:hypothetical protein
MLTRFCSLARRERDGSRVGASRPDFDARQVRRGCAEVESRQRPHGIAVGLARRRSLEPFGDVLMPILQEIGVTEQPEIYPAHAFVHA